MRQTVNTGMRVSGASKRHRTQFATSPRSLSEIYRAPLFPEREWISTRLLDRRPVERIELIGRNLATYFERCP